MEVERKIPAICLSSSQLTSYTGCSGMDQVIFFGFWVCKIEVVDVKRSRTSGTRVPGPQIA